MVTNTKEHILASAVQILAREGYAGTSMRKVAAAIGREQSSIYTHFADKETLLRETRLYINRQLDGLQGFATDLAAPALLRAMLEFQFRYRTEIVALLQYFMAMRADFGPTDGGYVPARAYEHMDRVIRQGVAEGAYHSDDIAFDAKTTTHMINGFLMEYFDRPLSNAEAARLVERLARFIERALSRQEARL
jgi:AcrR family transcriptional regulator